MSDTKPTFLERMQNLDRRILYAILVVFTTVPLFIKTDLPVEPDAYTKALYYRLMTIPQDKTVFLQSDWTVSTRGENAGHMEALLRILMSRKIKFVVYSVGDAQAPGVYREVIRNINLERKEAGLTEYKTWDDYVDLAYFPNAEGTLNAIAFDVRKAFASRRVKDPNTGSDRPAFESPVLSKVQTVGDAGLYMIVTASSTVDRAVERLNERTNLAVMCTGVIGPSALPWYQAGQIKGVAIGLKGVYDMEYMMKYGLNHPDPNKNGRIEVPWAGKEDKSAEPVTEGKTFARGSLYYLSFHFAILLLIIAVILGNVGMFLGRKAERAS
ncbi:MAG: hypothetical protein JSS66_02005 [Armatimonadetes bacterium]|nr:hypothetical protein [Armatimonadota bacterium]